MSTVRNPLYSFVTFRKEGTAQTVDSTVLPLILPSDVAFQTYIDFASSADADNFEQEDIYLYLVNGSGIITDNAQLLAAMIANYPNDGLLFNKYRLTATTILLYWPHGLPYVNLLPVGRCVRVLIKTEHGTEYFTSNVFQIVEADPYTSTLEYTCDENAYDFIYCVEDLVNKIRLPLYISRPQFFDEESIYIRSDGSFRITKSITKKEYEGKTDYFGEALHEKIKMALSHDTVNISSKYYTGGIRKNGNYEIEWPEVEDVIGMGKFKVNATPYKVRNSNCAECEPVGICNVSVIDVSIEDSEEQGGGNWSYIATWVNSGDAPASVSLEFSLDEGATWQPVPNGVQLGPNSFAYEIGLEAATNHKIRVTPICSNSLAGTAGTANYEL